MKKFCSTALTVLGLTVVSLSAQAEYVFESGHKSLKEFLLPDIPPAFTKSDLAPEKVALGEKLFFDPRFSKDGDMSCATCHSPDFGWSDGLPTAKGFRGMILDRASPTVINTAFNTIQMWDGRKKDLVDQATGPLEASVEMNTDMTAAINLMNTDATYIKMFSSAYPGETIDMSLFAKAVAAFEATIISNDTRFDHWVKGDKNAMTEKEIAGFKIFMAEDKGNCAACHSGANFTDNGFHSLGLEDRDSEDADPGRYSQVPLGIMFGAFKTPTIRESLNTAPYFHDGSATTLLEVVDYYASIKVGQQGISPVLKPISLTQEEKHALVAFMKAVSTESGQIAALKH